MSYTVGITGVTGKTGRRVAEGAAARGWQVRSLTRREPGLGTWCRLDWDDEATWVPGFTGCDAAYVLIPFNHPGAAERTPDLLRAAATAGVPRIVLLSSLDAEGAPADDPLAAAEAALAALEVDWAILRPTWFLENFSVGSFGGMVRDGELRLPAGDGRIPFVAVQDIAEVALAALAPDGPQGRLPLTGPAAVTHAEVCEALTAALGHPVLFADADDEEFIALMAQRGFSRDYCSFLIEALDQVRSGRLIIPVTDTVSRVTGRPATSVAQFAEALG
ncbi:NAD(P)H-binding protein [Microlunatus sp. GCM10028923]|uniref:NAD(P)H-binding protein n=1 Tax=Microlunatus sp. GCM10028923 TaxID=3273400 RepID=UPI003619DD7F